MIRHLLHIFILAGVALATPVLAQSALAQPVQEQPMPAQSSDPPSALAAPDQQAIRSVIESQLAAFQHDDGTTAFGYATPSIQQKFGDAANFMAMVRSGYTAVYRPRSVAFDKLVDTEFGPDQILQVIGPDGHAYTAHYLMQKQSDGTWMINGCYLTRGSDQNV